MNDCILGIGSNIQPEQNIQKMLSFLSKDHLLKKHSKWIKTSPIGIKDQDDFINGAVHLKTDLGWEEFTRYLKQLEDKMGRDRSLPKFGPRVIDLDIVVWNGEIKDDDYYTRDFVRNSVDQLL
jgi:2-amino-4-hydroxy-6-hydroxymethyldihydropteridine diphosphokinase